MWLLVLHGHHNISHNWIISGPFWQCFIVCPQSWSIVVFVIVWHLNLTFLYLGQQHAHVVMILIQNRQLLEESPLLESFMDFSVVQGELFWNWKQLIRLNLGVEPHEWHVTSLVLVVIKISDVELSSSVFIVLHLPCFVMSEETVNIVLVLNLLLFIVLLLL